MIWELFNEKLNELLIRCCQRKAFQSQAEKNTPIETLEILVREKDSRNV